MDKKLTILDISNKEYTVKDLKRFSEHIFNFHSKGISFHEENGFLFEIYDDFRNKILLFMKNYNS